MNMSFIEVRMKMSIADRYKDFVDNKPTKQQYKMAQESLEILLKQRNKLNSQLIKTDKLIQETRKFLRDYKDFCIGG